MNEQSATKLLINILNEFSSQKELFRHLEITTDKCLNGIETNKIGITELYSHTHPVSYERKALEKEFKSQKMQIESLEAELKKITEEDLEHEKRLKRKNRKINELTHELKSTKFEKLKEIQKTRLAQFFYSDDEQEQNSRRLEETKGDELKRRRQERVRKAKERNERERQEEEDCAKRIKLSNEQPEPESESVPESEPQQFQDHRKLFLRFAFKEDSAESKKFFFTQDFFNCQATLNKLDLLYLMV